MWAWAVHNVNRDFRERERLLFSFMESLTWWLQPELKKRVEDDKRNRMPDADLAEYAKGLREAGATEEYVERELAKIAEERRRERQARELLGDDDGDDMEVLRGPGA